MPIKNLTATNPENDDGPEVQEPGRTEFSTIVEALESAQESLRKMQNLNPQTLRLHLLQEVYPILIDFATHANWYTGDLHNRLSEVEEEVGVGDSEGLSPEFAEDLLEFIGVSMQLFGVIVTICKGDPEIISKVQLLIAKAPGLISRIRDITLEEEDEEEDDDDEDTEDPEVIEPRARQEPSVASAETGPVPVTPDGISFVPERPSSEPLPSSTATPGPDAVTEGSTASPDPDVVKSTTTSDEEVSNG